MKCLLTVAVAAAAWTSTAVAETFDWSGGYIGTHIGGRWVENQSNLPTRRDGSWGDADKIEKGAVGVFGGYNFVFGQSVIGVDASATLNAISTSRIDYVLDSEVRSKAKELYNLNVRLGYAMDNILPFVTGGLSYARYNNQVEHLVWGNPWVQDVGRSGWNIGGGIDFALTEKAIARMEYKFNDLGRGSIPNNFHIRYRQQTATLGIAYKF